MELEDELTHRPPLGASPVLLFPPPDEPGPHAYLFDYTTEFVEELESPSFDQFRQYLDRPSITWLDVHGLGDADLLERLGEALGLHPLAVANTVNLPQRARIDHYDDHIAIVARFVEASNNSFRMRHATIFVRENLVATFVQDSEEVSIFEPIRQRLRNPRALIRRSGSDFLAYAILDVIIDSYFPLIDHIDEQLDRFEEEIIAGCEDDILEGIHDLRPQMYAIKRSMSQHCDAIGLLIREEHPVLTDHVRPFLRDCYEHAIHLAETIENQREIGTTLRELQLSMNGQRLNDIIKVLTIISTIFIPLSFFAGVYGMNFAPEAGPLSMPELSWKYGYVGWWVFNLLLAATMLWWFKRKGWILTGRRRRSLPDSRKVELK